MLVFCLFKCSLNSSILFSCTAVISTDQSNRSPGFLNFQLTQTTSWLWRWLPHRLSKRQSLTKVLFRTPITQMIFFNQGMLLLGSNHFLMKHYSGSGRVGVLIPHSRPFFARIPHPARFSSVFRIPLFFPRKIHLKFWFLQKLINVM